MEKTTKTPIIKNHDWYVAMGRKGGLKNKAIQLAKNPNYFSDIGNRGGQVMKETHGFDFYSRIGSMGNKDQ